MKIKIAKLLSRGFSQHIIAKQLNIPVHRVWEISKTISHVVKGLENQNIEAKQFASVNCLKWRSCNDKAARVAREVLCLGCPDMDYVEGAFMMELVTFGQNIDD